MTVKRSQSAARVLAVLECVARHQPVGVSELARTMKVDKSAVQRAVMTLADEGWIRTTSATPSKWQLTAHILAVAHLGHMRNDLRQRARGALEALRDESGETVLLVVPDIRRFVVIDALESRNMLRTVPQLGLAVPVRQSATSRAVLPYMSRDQQIDLLGEVPDARLHNGVCGDDQARVLRQRWRCHRRFDEYCVANSRSGWASRRRRCSVRPERALDDQATSESRCDGFANGAQSFSWHTDAEDRCRGMTLD